MDKIVGEFDKCDECESLVDVYVEFHSRRGDLVKVCMNCLASAIVRPTKRAADGALCEDCGKNPVMNGCSVCAECGL